MCCWGRMCNGYRVSATPGWDLLNGGMGLVISGAFYNAFCSIPLTHIPESGGAAWLVVVGYGCCSDWSE